MPSPAPVTGHRSPQHPRPLRDLGVRPGETLLAHTSLGRV
ncbi:hypothetical protein EES44_09950 [Streptomyces sp. ADI96-15]|nr:hypothetical protein EES44_09950 [Streptomyces sp. ADI96-15]